MRATHKYLTTTLLGVVAVAGLGCGDPAGPKTGAIRVSVSTASLNIDVDPNGYTVAVDGGTARIVSPNGTLLIADVAAGNHVVQLDGLAPNCAVTSANPTSIDVEASRDPSVLTAVAFVVSCSPNVGSIQVSVVTSGADANPDGYVVHVSGVNATALGANSTRMISGVRVGQISVILDGTSGNCVITGGDQRLEVLVAFNAVTEVAFVINCVTAGRVLVTVTTAGVDLDSNGYSFELTRLGVGGFAGGWLPPNGSVLRTGLLPGDYVLNLSDIEPNCSAGANPGPVTVIAGSETQVALHVECAALSKLAFVSVLNGNNSEIFVAKTNFTDLTQLTFNARQDANPAWSPDGNKIAFATNRDGNLEIYVMDADGRNPVRLTTSETAQDGNPAWSPDGTRIAFESERNSGLDIYVMNADGTNEVRLTDNASPDYSPAWSPDGKRIAFTSNRDGTTGIWLMNADGSAQIRLTTSSFGDFQPTWSPDGSRIAFSARPSASAWAIFAVNADGSGRARITADFELAIDPAWSPDGRKIAFTRKTQCGWYDYYCDEGIVIVGTDGGQYSFVISGVTSEPAWRP